MAGGGLKYHSDGNLTRMFSGVFDRAQKRAEDDLDSKLKRLNELILARTPVWEGDTIHNWRWSTRAPDYRHEDPIRSPQYPGHTSKMPLGQEPRRAANETRARQSLAGALRAKTPQDIYLTNSSDSAAELEYGLLPTPAASRSKRGIVRLSVKEVFGGYA